METFESIPHMTAGVILTQLGNQRGAKPERRGVRRESCRAPTQDGKAVRRAFLRHIADGEPVQGPAHRGHDSQWSA